jgi:DNA ligase 1
MSFKPMLAPGEDPLSFPDYFKKLKYPLLASPKFDGIRCTVKNSNALSRSGKLLPSTQVQSEFTSYNHLDGEIIEGDATDFGVYNRTQGFVMSYNKPGNLAYYVFDYCHPDWLNRPFYERLSYAKGLIPSVGNYYFIEHEDIEDYDALIAYEEKQLALGFEGIMMRDPVGRYKNGRGTFNEGLIYKLKRFKDAEAVIVDIIEGFKNENAKEKDELGFSKRSEKAEGLVKSGMAGRIIGRYEGQEIDIAPGAFTHDERIRLLADRTSYIGSMVKFRYMEHGMKDKPRFPRALGLRGLMDL